MKGSQRLFNWARSQFCFTRLSVFLEAEPRKQLTFKGNQKNITELNLMWSGEDPGEVKWVNFHPPFSEPPSFFSFSYPSNIEIIFDFSDIITKIHPPFQNPGSALVALFLNNASGL